MFKILQELHCKEKRQIGSRQPPLAGSHARGATVLLPAPCPSPIPALSPAGTLCDDVFCFFDFLRPGFIFLNKE